MAQDLKPTQPVRLPNPSAQPFVAALRTARLFAVVFFWITMVSVLLYVVAFALTEWVGLYDDPLAAAPPPVKAPAEPVTPAAAGGVSWFGPIENSADAATSTGRTKGGFFGVGPTRPDEEAETDTAAQKFAPSPPPADTLAPPATSTDVTSGKLVGTTEAPPEVPQRRNLEDEQHKRAVLWTDRTKNTLQPLKVVGVMSGFLLGITVFLYLQIALLGRLGGIKQLTVALFMCILFLASVLPWGDIFPGFNVCSYYDFGYLLKVHARMAVETEFLKIALYYCRFFVLPVASVVLLAWAGIQFSSGYGDSVVANE